MVKKILSGLIVMALAVNLLILSQDDVTATNSNNKLAVQYDSLFDGQGLALENKVQKAALENELAAQLRPAVTVSSLTLTDDGVAWQAKDFSVLCEKDGYQVQAGQIGYGQNEQLTTVNAALSGDGHFYAPKNIELSAMDSSNSASILSTSNAVGSGQQNVAFAVVPSQPGLGTICVLAPDNTFRYAEAQFGNNISGNPLIVDGAVVWEN